MNKISFIIKEDGFLGLIEKIFSVISKYIFTFYYRLRFGSFGSGSFVEGPISIQGGKRISIGNNVIIRKGCLFRTGKNGTIKIASGCFIDQSVTLISEGNLVIKSDVKIFNNSKIASGKEIVLNDKVWIARECSIGGNNIVLEERVILGPGVCILDGDHKIDSETKEIQMKSGVSDPILIQSNAWLGLRTVILKGVTVGKGSIIGAGSVVTKDVTEGSLFTGSAAQFKKRI